ncbi:MAG: hypothetical protein AB1508_11450 [Pseudomonadota bacterium]
MTSEPTEDPEHKPPREAAAEARKPSRLRQLLAITWVVLAFFVAIYEGRDVIAAIRNVDLAAGKAIGSVSIVGLSDAFLDRFEQCQYQYLVFCQPRPSPVCDVFCGEEGGLPVLAWDGLKILPRLPDAIWHVLKTRFELGQFAEFVLTLIFVGLCVFGWIGALSDRSEYGTLGSIFVFLISITFVPLVISLAFWTIQEALLLLSSAIGLTLQALLLIAVVPGLAALSVGSALVEAGKKIFEFVRHPFA